MPFAYITLAELKTALATRLGDTGKVYWIDAELSILCKEALRTWGLFTGYWRDTGSFTTVSGTAFYDIQTLTNASTEALLSYTVTDQDLITAIQYHLLEPATGSSWTGSEQFTLADLTGALQRRRDALLGEVGAVLTHATQALIVGDPLMGVPDTTLNVRRMAFFDAAGNVSPLFPDDINSQRNYASDFLTTAGTPLTYSNASAGPLQYVIAPPSSQPGSMDIISTRSGAGLDATGVALGIPDDMAWIVKWGALADLLGKEGPGQDLGRSYFCERRWALGIALARMYPTVINAKINGVSTSPEGIAEMDAYDSDWQSTSAAPEFVISMRNLIGLAPNPDGVYSIVLDVVRKAPIPTADGSSIQIGREYINVILDYATHLAAFKSGGVEFKHTYRGATNFFRAALAYNQKLMAQNSTAKTLLQQSMEDEEVRPMQVRAGNQILKSVATTPEQ